MKYVLVVVCVLASPASADPDKVTAEASFVAAKDAERAGKIAEACALYETSYRADPALGALLNLANCHETLGRSATAWAEFREAVEIAARKGDARAAFAQRHADAIAPRLVRLQITAAPGVTVRRNAVDVTATIGQALVVDPGSYEITASAPNKTSWTSSVAVARPGEITRVEVPALADIVVTAPPPPAPVAAPVPVVIRAPVVVAKPVPAEHRNHTWAYAFGAASIVSLGVGAGFGFHARGQWQASRDPSVCDSHGVCSPAGTALIDSARSSAKLSTISFAAGASFAVAAGVAWWLAPRGERRIAVAPTLDHPGVAAAARF